MDKLLQTKRDKCHHTANIFKLATYIGFNVILIDRMLNNIIPACMYFYWINTSGIIQSFSIKHVSANSRRETLEVYPTHKFLVWNTFTSALLNIYCSSDNFPFFRSFLFKYFGSYEKLFEMQLTSCICYLHIKINFQNTLYFWLRWMLVYKVVYCLPKFYGDLTDHG